ncbi:MAG TPA: metallophosphoesterase family protein [Vicinamibacterales bacterium]|nr:metallophosphoesterase family protein [Vicinamibacterales bacterium]
MKLAILSDIHGNRWALEAVLDELALTPVDVTINLGDSLWGVLDPAGTADILMSLPMRSVRGNTDRDLLAPPTAKPPAIETHSRAALTNARRVWLERHEPPFVVDGVLACHGTPESDSRTLLEDVTEQGARRRSGEEVGGVLGHLSPDVSIVLCGHSHVPGVVQVPGGPLVVNPGSIGLPAYRHHVPHPHRMESGSPHARYAVIHRQGKSWRVELRAVVYDWSAAAARADEIGRADWAHALRTGHAMTG